MSAALPPQTRASVDDVKHSMDHEEKHAGGVLPTELPIPGKIQQKHADLYVEALERYGIDGEIDPVAEKKLVGHLGTVMNNV